MKDKASMFSAAWRLTGDDRKPVAEYRFHPVRRWRFDWAFPDSKVSVEVDGGRWSPNGGRHAGDSDKEKQNAAAELGWKVFHFSPMMLRMNPLGCAEQVRRSLDADKL